MSKQENNQADPVVVKKYANRRLYNTSTSAYVTLDDLSQMVKDGDHFVVFDAKSGEDITRSVLTQIIFEEEGKGQNLLPINFLRQLIGFYGNNMQAFVPSYLEFSLDSLTREQERFRQKMTEAGGEPFQMMEQHAKRNMAMFQQAMQMFNPFAATADGAAGKPASAESSTQEHQEEPPKPETDELEALRKQMDDLQRQLQTIAASKKED